MAGTTISKTQLCAFWAITPKTAMVWQEEGMPFTPPETVGGANTYNSVAVLKWWLKRNTKDGMDVNEERARLARAQTESANLRNEEKRGNLIPMDLAGEVAQRAAFAIRQKIVNSSMTDSEKRAILVDIHALGDMEFDKLELPPDEDEGPAPENAVAPLSS